MFWNVVLQKDGDQWDLWCEIWVSITLSQKGYKITTYRERRLTALVTLAYELTSKHVTEGRIKGRTYRSDGKTRKKTYEATGWGQRNERILEIERVSTRSQSLENSLWKRLWTCRKTDCGMKWPSYFLVDSNIPFSWRYGTNSNYCTWQTGINLNAFSNIPFSWIITPSRALRYKFQLLSQTNGY